MHFRIDIFLGINWKILRKHQTPLLLQQLSTTSPYLQFSARKSRFSAFFGKIHFLPLVQNISPHSSVPNYDGKTAVLLEFWDHRLPEP